jgi:type II restriction/modification system DNA methylase subunit YeeA
MEPLRREWAAIKAKAEELRPVFDDLTATPKVRTNRGKELEALRTQMLEKVRNITVLDPACGSGNFLYVALNLLLDFEKSIINDPVFAGLTLAYPEVHPRQLYGIEINPIAHALASIVVWIGYIQWRKNNGYLSFKEPILEALGNNIKQMDAILQYDADGNAIEPEWPRADVIVSNPPFLGGNNIRAQLGNQYVDTLFKLYSGRVPAFADLVCYWFEKARKQIEDGKIKRAGLLSTNSIRGGVNREVLKRIKNSGDIFMAWSDRDWTLDGAAVRVSMVGFDDSAEKIHTLDGNAVDNINADLTGTINITIAAPLEENLKICFIGTKKAGPFDLDEVTALKMLNASNESERDNKDVISPWLNGERIVKRLNSRWIINFGEMSQEEASLYSQPFEYVKETIYPIRQKNNEERARVKWWQHRRPAIEMMESTRKLSRFIATPRVSKHRIFEWFPSVTTPDDGIYVFAREDDYFFGVLHSRLHEVWSLRMGTSLEDRPRYTPTTTFETFPFPWTPGKEDTASAAYQRISAAAKQLHAERDTWLNPPGMSESSLKDRTLTNLYNALNVFRGKDKMKIKPDAGDFAPRLDALHNELDAAVVAAYGWDASILEDEEAMLRHLLALNLERGTPST